MLAYKEEDATHLISQALWVMNLLVSLREVLETHPHMGRMMDGAHALRFLHREDHCSKFWSPSASEPTNYGLPLQTFLWSALGKQWFLQYRSSGATFTSKDHGVKCRDEPFPGLRSGVLSCPFFTAACHSHGSYVNWIWIKYTPTFAQTSSSSSLLVSRKT